MSKDVNNVVLTKVEFEFNQQGDLRAAKSSSGSFVSEYIYVNHDARGRAQNVTQEITVSGTHVHVEFDYTYNDSLQGDAKQSDAAVSGYVVTASNIVKGGEVLYTNTYQYDAIGREVFTEQLTGALSNAKRITHEYLFGATDETPTPDWAPYGSRRELVKRMSNVNGSYDVVSKTVTYYEDQDSQLVRRINELKGDGTPLKVSFGGSSRDVAFHYNYDSADRLVRSFDYNSSTNQQHDTQPFYNPDPGSEFGQIDEVRPGGVLLADDIKYDNEGRVKELVAALNGSSASQSPAKYSVRWDPANRITRIRNENNIVEETFLYYDAFGRIVAKNTLVDQVDVYVYDGDAQTLRFEETGRLRERSLFSAGQLAAIDFAPLLNTTQELQKSGSTLWTLTDSEGSVRETINRTGTVVKSTISYDGSLAVSGESPPAGALVHRGLQYIPELKGYFNGSIFSSNALGGRTLSVASLAGPVRYGVRDPGRPNKYSPDDDSGLIYKAFRAIGRSDAQIAGMSDGDVNGLAFAASAAITLGAAGIYAAGVYLGGATAAKVGAAATATVVAARVAGGVVGAAHAAADVYASNPNAGIGTYAVAIGLGTASGVLLPQAAFASAAGAVVGGLVEASGKGAFLGNGFQAGGLLGGLGYNGYRALATNGSDWARRCAMFGFAKEAGGTAAGAGAGWYIGGTTESTLLGANLGMLGGNILSAFWKSCFVAGTPIRWEHGQKAIEDFQVGERVWARDEFDPDGPLEFKEIEECFIRQAPVLELKIGGRTIGTTGEHPFFVQGRGWTAARELESGDLLASGEGGWLAVENCYDTGRVETVYNFRVADHHTYFVQGEDWEFGVWAHNASYPGKATAPGNAGAAIDGAHHLDDLIDDLVDGFQSHQRLQRSASDVIQNHHLITQRMARALDKVGLPGQALRNRIDLQKLSSPGGHIGQEAWHISMEKEMMNFIQFRGKSLTENDLLEKIHHYYQQSDVASRIPNVDLGF